MRSPPFSERCEVVGDAEHGVVHQDLDVLAEIVRPWSQSAASSSGKRA